MKMVKKYLNVPQRGKEYCFIVEKSYMIIIKIYTIDN